MVIVDLVEDVSANKVLLVIGRAIKKTSGARFDMLKEKKRRGDGKRILFPHNCGDIMHINLQTD